MIVCVYSNEAPTVQNCFRIAQLIGHIWYSRYTSVTEIVTGDDIGLGLAIVRVAESYGYPVRVMGIRRRARNGVTPYTRVIGGYTERDAFMVGYADVCHFLGEKTGGIATKARILGKRVHAYPLPQNTIFL